MGERRAGRGSHVMTTRTLKVALGVAVAIALLFSSGLLAGLGRQPIRPYTAAHRRPPPADRTATATHVGAASAPTHLVLLVEENHELGQVIGSPKAPFLDRLAASGTLLTNYYAVGHPSLPNYLALIGCDTFGIHNDCTSCQTQATSPVDQLDSDGISSKAYYQNLPAPAANVSRAGAYTKKVDPFLYFDDILTSPARSHKVVPIAQLNRDLVAARLPRFVVVAPDLRHDMHSG